MIHLLVQRPFVDACWRRLRINVQQMREDSFGPWIAQLLNKVDKQQAGMVAMVCWALWNARNDWAWNKKQPSAMNEVESTKMHLEQWMKAQNDVLIIPCVNDNDGAKIWVRHQCILQR